MVLHIDNSSALVSHNRVTSNRGGGYASGIFIYNSDSAVVSHNYIRNNICVKAAGISCVHSSILLSNNVITNHTALNNTGLNWDNAGGLHLSTSSPTLRNNTIANNFARKGGGMHLTNDSNPPITNTIIYGNSSTSSTSDNQLFINYELSGPNLSYSNVEGGVIGFDMNGHFNSGITQNNLDTLSYFVNPTLGAGNNSAVPFVGWLLSINSSCINAGYPTGTFPTTDIAGNARVMNDRIDLGAFEIQRSLGLKDATSKNQINLFPNPASNQVTIVTPPDLAQTFQLKIVDLTSGLVLEQNQSNTEITKINVTEFTNGVYIAQFISADKLYSRPFIKQ